MMKATNPWVIVRWAMVMFIYAATVLIAIDQVKIRERRISELEECQKRVSKGLDKLSASNNSMMGITNEALTVALKMKADSEKNKSDLDKLAKLQELMELNCQRLQKQEESKLLTGRLERHLANSERIKKLSDSIVASGTATQDDLDKIKNEAEKHKENWRVLNIEVQRFKQDLATIDERRGVLKKECGID